MLANNIKLGNNWQNVVNRYKTNGGVTIIGLNDSQLVSVNPFAKGSVDYLAEAFRNEGVPATTLNGGSMFYNKAEHGRSIVENNLTIKEIELLNSYSFLAAASKLLKRDLPEWIERFIRLSFDSRGKEDIRISELLQNNPILITSFIANNLMREVANSPLAVGKDYKNKDKTSDYDYTLSKMSDTATIERVMEEARRTYDVILPRTNGQIYGIGLFLPRSIAKNDGEKLFEEYIYTCNEAYKSLCEEFGVNYVDVSNLGKFTGMINFHARAGKIADAILQSVIESNDDSKREVLQRGFVTCGLDGMESDAIARFQMAEEAYRNNPHDIVTQKIYYERIKELSVAGEANYRYQEYLQKRR